MPDNAPFNILPENEAYLISHRRLISELIFLAFCGAFFSLAFPAYNISILGWIGLIPLYLIIRNKLRPGRAFICGFVWGYFWALFSFFWLRRIEPFIPFAMALVLAMFPAFWAAAITLMRRNILIPNEIRLLGFTLSKKYLIENRLHLRKIAAVLIFTSLWCSLEWLRGWIFSGLPWNYMAVTQYQKITMLQCAGWTGVYGISFIIVFFNISLAECAAVFLDAKKYKISFHMPGVIYMAAVLIILNLFLGIFIISDKKDTQDSSQLKALLIQGDLPQMRMYSPEQAVEALETYTGLSKEMLSKNKDADILIWPESAVPQPYNSATYLSYQFRAEIDKLMGIYKIPLLVGAIYYDPFLKDSEGIPRVYNSALLIGRNYKIETVYSKIHLVPWGEYTPGENIFPLKYFYPWIKKKFGMGRSLTHGKQSAIFNLKPGIRAGVLICFEDAFAYVARRHVLSGANLLITLTNDAWFPDTNEPAQHLAEAVFRSVENRRPTLRSGNNSGTCVIDEYGRFTDSIFKKTSGSNSGLEPDKQGRGGAFFVVDVKTDPPLTFYTRYGNIFIILLNTILFISFIWCFMQWQNRKNTLYRLIAEKQPEN